MTDPARGNPFDFLKLLFGFERRVDKRTYLLTGLALMALKYATEFLVVWWTTGVVWSPLDYFDPQLKSRFALTIPFPFLLTTLSVPPPTWLPWGLALWTLPFIWIGVSMSVRRAADAGKSPWLGLLFMVPYANYLLMLVFSLLPTAPQPGWFGRAAGRAAPRTTQLVGSCAVGVLLGLGMIALSVFVFRDYSAYSFLGAPLVFGSVTGYLVNRASAVTWPATVSMIVSSLLVLGLLVMTVAIEGVVCIAMALPLAIPLALVGASVGREIALRSRTPPPQAFMVVIALPILAALEARDTELPLHEVRSSIEIAAPPDRVWRDLLAFGTITDPPSLVFRLGIACPTQARIEGHGIGSIRYCEFSTGAFVEPITVWDEPRILAFDVAAQPSPMVEWSPYDIHPPHLDGFLRSRRGEFRLVALPGGGTRLEGSTWYTLDIHPDLYWRLYADALIEAIHGRVLRHIRALAESR